jgi:hypothetical protein
VETLLSAACSYLLDEYLAVFTIKVPPTSNLACVFLCGRIHFTFYSSSSKKDSTYQQPITFYIIIQLLVNVGQYPTSHSELPLYDINPSRRREYNCNGGEGCGRGHTGFYKFETRDEFEGNIKTTNLLVRWINSTPYVPELNGQLGVWHLNNFWHDHWKLWRPSTFADFEKMLEAGLGTKEAVFDEEKRELLTLGDEFNEGRMVQHSKRSGLSSLFT